MFQRKSSVIKKLYLKDNYQIEYTVAFKKIKHTYFRFKDNILYISTKNGMNVNDIEKIIELNLDKILNLQNKVNKKKIESNKYQLWGETLTEEEFFGSMEKTESNLYKIYKEETEKKIKQLELKVLERISILGLELRPTSVKKLKGKYGYCNILKKDITINSFLAKLDPIYLFYVLLHEYAHLVVANHQKPFYDCLDKMMINHKEVQKRLRKHTIMF